MRCVNGLRTNVIDEDPDLFELVGDSHRDALRAASNAAVITVPVGGWSTMDTAPQEGRGGYGLLMLEGLAVRRAGFDGRWGAELVGPGDIVRPWDGDGDMISGTMAFEASWRIMTPVRAAVLDLPWAARMSGYPTVGAELLGRTLRRGRRLVMAMAIVQVPRLDDRLWLIFWDLADRWGRVRTDGVYLDVPLTHELLSHLAAARRPSVSGALTRLGEQGRLRRAGRAWVLLGDPPEDGLAGGAADAVASPG